MSDVDFADVRFDYIPIGQRPIKNMGDGRPWPGYTVGTPPSKEDIQESLDDPEWGPLFANVGMSGSDIWITISRPERKDADNPELVFEAQISHRSALLLALALRTAVRLDMMNEMDDDEIKRFVLR